MYFTTLFTVGKVGVDYKKIITLPVLPYITLNQTGLVEANSLLPSVILPKKA